MTPPYKMGHLGKMWLSEICIFPTNLLSASYNFAANLQLYGGNLQRRAGERGGPLSRTGQQHRRCGVSDCWGEARCARRGEGEP